MPDLGYSPPCFAFSGDNGGATARGVTADTIRVSYRVTSDPNLLLLLGQQALQAGRHEERRPRVQPEVLAGPDPDDRLEGGIDPDRLDVDGQQATDFTAIARRADGKLVLGSADGAVYTLSSETAVGAQLKIFARVDALVTQGNTTVVLDRGQTSVTTVDASGADAEQALRAGEGATTLAADAAGRVLVADTRGDELLVFGADPLILRQRYPVRDAPYGLAGSSRLAWVSQTATNTVVGYDLATGIPVEKVRYRTVQQPNSLAFDDSSGTLYVVSGSGAGVQAIADAAVSR